VFLQHPVGVQYQNRYIPPQPIASLPVADSRQGQNSDRVKQQKIILHPSTLPGRQRQGCNSDSIFILLRFVISLSLQKNLP